MYIPLLSVARGHPPPHCENTQVLREAITEDDDDDGVRRCYVVLTLERRKKRMLTYVDSLKFGGISSVQWRKVGRS